jgi:PKD repeat protein
MFKDYNISFTSRCPIGTLCTLWSVYTATHALLDFNQTSLDLLVTKFNIIEPVEVGNPLAFQISVNLNNTIIYADFNDGTVKNYINNAYALYDYKDAGTNNVNFTAISLSNSQLTDTCQIEIKVFKKSDRSPMESVKIYIKESTDLQVSIRILANGGTPFICNLTFGENSPMETIKSENRSLVYSVIRQFNSTGLYNVSAICRSDFRKDITVSDWKIVYIPDSSISSPYKDPKYSFDNVNYIYVERRGQKLLDEIDLKLPFKTVPTNLRFDIVDLVNPSNSFAYIYTKRLVTLVNFSIKLSSGYLSKDKCYFMIKTNDIYLATYIITIQDIIDTAPQIILKTNPIKINDNEAGLFLLNITQTYPYSILKFDYGDGAFEIYDIDDARKGVLIQFEHNYTKFGQYNAVATLSNYISSVQSSMRVPFELKLAEFQLILKSNISDITEDVTFILRKIGGNVLTAVDGILFKEDENATGNFLSIQKDYIFNASNSFSYTFVYKYKKFGLFQPSFQVLSVAGTVKYSIVLKIGLDLDGITAFTFNNYALVGEYVKIYLRIDDGNGYDVSVKFSDTDEMVIPWAYTSSNGSSLGSPNPNQIRPLAQILSRNLMYIMYQYPTAGAYSIRIRVTNPFSSLVKDLCSKTVIAPQNPLSYPITCTLTNDNTYIRLVEDIDNKDDLIKLAKSLPNTLRVIFPQCQQENTTIYWTLTQLKDRLPFPMEKYCFVSTSFNEYVLDKGELEFGTYNLTVTVVSNSNPSYYKQLQSKQLTVDLSKLIAKIQGGADVILGWNETYIMDFYSKSYDPEAIDVNDKSALSFDVICSKEFSSLSADDTSKSLDAAIAAGRFNFEELDFQIAFQFNKIKFYQKDCFHSSDQEYLNSAIEFDYENNNFMISMTTLNLNESSMIPITMRLFVRDDNRVSRASQALNLNTSNSFLAIPGDLDMMSKQLDKLDDLAAKDPKMALGFVSKFADAINSYGSPSSSDVSI